ncbi:MAG: type II secretion system secretin GspD [Polyangiales bacterium]
MSALTVVLMTTSVIHPVLAQTAPTPPAPITAVPARPRVGGLGGASVGGGVTATPGATPPAPVAPAGVGVGAAGTGPGAAPGAASSASTGPTGKRTSDTGTLSLAKEEIEFEPRPPGYKVQFSLEDADLPELIKVMGQLTGKRFIFGGKVRNIKATIYSPQKVTVAEAYQAFLSILETNGLTVIPHGKFLKIVESPGIVSQVTPVYGSGSAGLAEDRFITRLHRLTYVTADEVSNVLGHFKSRDGDITIYSPGNLLIITDTGSNIKRMMSLIEEIDVASVGDQVWVEPIHYASAQEVSTKLQEIFDVKGGGGGGAPGGAKGPGSQSVDARVTKIISEERSNSVIIVGTEKAYLKILELIRIIDLPLSGEGEIHVLPLQHADAEELSKTLGEIAGTKGGASGASAGAKPAAGGPTAAIFEGAIRITADKSTNSLVITSSLRDYASLRAVIDRLDQARRQVYLEAVVMEVSTNHGQTLGVSFHGGDSVSGPTSDGSVILGGSDAGSSIGFPNITDPTALQGLALGVRSNTTIPLGAVGLSLPAFGVALHAMATSSDANVLSTPHIMATDNVPAEINVGENVGLQSSTGGLGALGGLGGLAGASGATGALGGLGGLGGLSGFGGGISRQNVGTKLKFVPHINDSNEVRLEIDEEISELGAALGPATNPRITQRTVKTQVVIQDQQTIVIGGLVRDVASNQETKVPILGDIPLIGILFKQTTKSIQKKNLLLILTPYVIRDPADLRQIFERKMQERQEFLDRYFVFAGDTVYRPPLDYTRTRGLVEEIRQAYMRADEKSALELQTRPKEIKGHDPSEPIGELPTSSGGGAVASGGGGGGPLTPSMPAPTPLSPGPAAPPGAPTVVRPVGPLSRSVIIEN